MEDYQSKYLKYKMKYLSLKNKYVNQIGGVTEEEFKTYLKQLESAKRREQSPKPLSKDVLEPEPINPHEDKLEKAALERQLRELGLSPPPSPSLIPPEKYAQMQELFDQARYNKQRISRNSKPKLYKAELSPEEADILDKQLAELYNESDRLSHSTPIKQINRISTELSSSAPIRTHKDIGEPMICKSSKYNAPDLDINCKKHDRVGQILFDLQPSLNTSCKEAAELKHHICQTAINIARYN